MSKCHVSTYSEICKAIFFFFEDSATDLDKDSFSNELQTMRDIPCHPNIIRLLGYSIAEDGQYLRLKMSQYSLLWFHIKTNLVIFKTYRVTVFRNHLKCQISNQHFKESKCNGIFRIEYIYTFSILHLNKDGSSTLNL